MVDTPDDYPNSREAGAVRVGQSRFVTFAVDGTTIDADTGSPLLADEGQPILSNVDEQFADSREAAAVLNGTSQFLASSVDPGNLFPNSRMAQSARDGQSQFITEDLDTPDNYPNSREAGAVRIGQSRMRHLSVDDASLFPNSRMAQAVRAGLSRIKVLGGAPEWVLRAGGVAADVDLDFVGGKYWGGTLPDLVSLTRSSTGYAQNSAGLLVSFAANVPRITDLGLLVEDGRANQCLRSQQFANAAWTKTAITAADGALLAPDSTLTASTLTEDTTTATHQAASSNFTATSGVTYTASVYAKFGTQQFLQLTFGSAAFGGIGYANFDLVNGTISATGGTLVGSGIVAIGNGWYRCWISASATSTTAGLFAAILQNSGSAGRSASYLGTGKALHVWGAQVEAGGFACPTSYTPTTNANAQRSGDVCTAQNLLSSILKSAGYSYNVKAQAPPALFGAANLYLLQSSDASLNNRIDSMIVSPSGNASFRHNVAPAPSTGPGDRVGSFLAGAVHNIGRAVDASNDRTFYDGASATAAVQTAMPVVTQVNIAQAFNGLSLNSYLKRLSVWSSPISMLGVNP